MAAAGDFATEVMTSSPPPMHESDVTDDDLPQCKIKRNYSCTLCPFFSQNPRSFLYHSRDVHFDKIKIYECSQCLYASKHSQKLQRHINMIHIPGRETVKKIIRRPSERRQVAAVKLEPLPPQPGPSSEIDQKTEMESGTRLKCSVCSFTSSSTALITRHERVVHLKKRFLRCNKCSYVTHVKARFTKHVKYHSMPMIKCDLCDFRTPYKWNLDRHYKNHCGSGAFQCSKCNFRADIKQSLTVHEMNHHVPPVGAGAAILLRKKNKVGASDSLPMDVDSIDNDEMELLRLEREDDGGGGGGGVIKEETDDEEPDLNADLPGKLETALISAQTARPRPSPFVHPEVSYKTHKCRFCTFSAAYPQEITRHEKRLHGKDKRPPPNLIPLQGNSPSPILKIPDIRVKQSSTDEPTVPVNEEEFTEMCKKSSLTKSLKEFVSMIGYEEALKSIPDPNDDDHYGDDDDDDDDDDGGEKLVPRESESSPQHSIPDALRMKNSSFFDKLREKLGNTSNDEVDLFCEICGHESKCLSESVAHEKIHDAEREDLVVSGTELSSTRCQHCRHRCKTSADLVRHLKKCKAFEAAYESKSREPTPELPDYHIDEPNRVFVWNEFPQGESLSGEDAYDMDSDDYDDAPPEFPLEVQLETSGPPTPPPSLPRTAPSAAPPAAPSEAGPPGPPPQRGLSLKKVFKCPHCNFWASTASRFHVHIVGHLNKKPFECSLCNYRSNWRWDITKHIRLKSARDPNHTQATVNMTDETGRRNYSKYNKYLTMMKVQEPTADSSGTGKRTRPCDLTQGTVKEGDILQPIPEPPKLTPAPHQLLPGSAGAPTLRPPPPLHAAHMSSVCKKTLWKCKKCLYRNSDKEKVLAHVKGHYGKKMGEEADVIDTTEDHVICQTVAEPLARKLFKCGHCQLVSNWRKVIQRHCRLIHDGNIIILPGTEADKSKPSLDSGQVLCSDVQYGLRSPSPEDKNRPTMKPPTAEDLRGPFACEICPFRTGSCDDLSAHKLNHIDRPGSIFKCTFCPFYVPSKIAVLEHMEVHGVDRVDHAKHNVENFDPAIDCSELAEGMTEEMKRYQCKHCPYVSNSKTQFLYHKQFHRPRNAPYKCNYCTYNVSRRHLLHQHLRVHHTYRNCSEDDDVPLFWVFRGGTYLKMYKCRWCPHVNVRKTNILDHEKMHKDNCKLHCPDCSYTCNNPGVMSSHAKVHSGCFGEIKSLVDPYLSDQEQIQTLQKSAATEPSISIKEEPIDPDLNTPESSYYRSNNMDDEKTKDDPSSKTVSFCHKCPARFMFKKELRIHSRFHLIRLPFKCSFCSYTARQRPHLLAHYKVHSQDYQERTADLVDTYMVNPEHQQPKTAMVTNSSEEIQGPAWSVLLPENLTAKEDVSRKQTKPVGKHPCHRCPAKFFKSVALQYHLTLHGGGHHYRCKYCDYTVKNYGNLVKHQLVHENSRGTQPDERAPTPEKKPDPQFGLLMHGSPHFVYPLYLKNGKLKEKRYKCHKCPSAFEKRDQYRVHLSLHGSKQKYKCEECDYSVKYYANYVQHMKKHKRNEVMQQDLDVKIELDDDTKSPALEMVPSPLPPPPPLTQIERQMLILMERKQKITKDDELAKKMLQCELCPYTNPRKDCLENHERRHFILSGIKYGFDCPHCDYSTTQQNFLREHSRVHFKSTGLRTIPEAFMLVKGLELWLEQEGEEGKTVFKDCEDGSFEPELADHVVEEEVDDNQRIFVDLVTGDAIEDDLYQEEMGPIHEDDQSGVAEPDMFQHDLIEMVQVPDHVPSPERPKIKRMRGKNWKCKKCPHAFGKKDQYLRHISLHASNQRYSCDICDYSVKFYTNYVQHMRMHQTHEPDREINIKQYVAGTDAKSPIHSPITVTDPHLHAQIDELQLLLADSAERLSEPDVLDDVNLEGIEDVDADHTDADAEDSDSGDSNHQNIQLVHADIN